MENGPNFGATLGALGLRVHEEFGVTMWHKPHYIGDSVLADENAEIRTRPSLYTLNLESV
jgi:hypothetical protein